MECEPVNSRIDYTDALEAVQAAIDDAGSVRKQVREALAEYFEPLLPEPAPPEAPPIRLGSPVQQNVFPPACPRCLQRRDKCLCPSMFPGEQPPF